MYCTRCKTDKPETDFYLNRHPGRAKTGRQNYCKECQLEAQKKCYRTPKSIARRKRDLEKILQDPVRAAAYRKRRNEAQARWREKNKDRYIAKYKLRMAVRSGKVTKKKVCQDCGKPRKTWGYHHKGFDEKHWMDVLWLCSACVGLRKEKKNAK